MKKSLIITLLVMIHSYSSAAILFFENETDWLVTAGATASDVSSQTYDGATITDPVDDIYITSGGTGGAVTYTLVTTPSNNVSFSDNDDFRTGVAGLGLNFSTPSGTGDLDPPAVDVATLTVTEGTVFSFSFNVHDLFDSGSTSTDPNFGEYGFNVEITLVGGASETVFDTGNNITGVGGNQSGSVAYTGPGGSTGNSILVGDDTIIGDDGAFFGFTSTLAIESITLTKTTEYDRNDNWGFDEFNVISTAAVPEPSSAALLGLGGLALILRRRN